jgi:hypothetical protein
LLTPDADLVRKMTEEGMDAFPDSAFTDSEYHYSEYRFVRAARPMTGEKPMYLPSPVVVDLVPTTLADAGFGQFDGFASRSNRFAIGAALTIGLSGANFAGWDAPLAGVVGQDDDEKKDDKLDPIPTPFYGPSVPRIGPARYVQIIFNPDGTVQNDCYGPGMSMIPIWVRDGKFSWQTTAAICDGEMALVVVHLQTGHVAVHSVDRTIQDDGMRYGDPYSYARQGGYSGK